MPFDLDDDEYRATRILTGADKVDDIKVGDFIRTKEWGIAKVHMLHKDNKVTSIKNKNNRITHYFTQLKEPSKNIIDLIEVGDYVNGYKINRIETEIYNMKLDEVVPLQTPKLIVGNEEGILSIKEIRSVVTKEQFKSVEYKVGG